MNDTAKTALLDAYGYAEGHLGSLRDIYEVQRNRMLDTGAKIEDKALQVAELRQALIEAGISIPVYGEEIAA